MVQYTSVCKIYFTFIICFCFQQGVSSTSSGGLSIAAVIGGAVGGVVVIVIIIIMVILVLIHVKKRSHLVSSVHVIPNDGTKGNHFTHVTYIHSFISLCCYALEQPKGGCYQTFSA